MSYKPNEKDWMAYLYGELSGEEKERFEKYLLENEEARLELEKYNGLRSLMSGLEDKEVIAPPIVVSEAKQRFFENIPYLKTVFSIAASLLIVMLFAKLVDLHINVSRNELKLSFGQPVEANVPLEKKNQAQLTEEQVKQMITASLESNNTALQATLKENEEKLTASIKKNLALSSGNINELVKQASTASQDQIRSYVSGLQSENMQMVKDYFQLTSTEQKKYMENLLVDFAGYLQQQRNNDLQLVQSRLKSIEKNSDLFKQETEQILSGIITTVRNTPGKEIKN
jgi:hypothetical protein